MTAADWGAGPTGTTQPTEEPARHRALIAPRVEGTLVPWQALPSEIELTAQVPRANVAESELETAVAHVNHALDQVGVMSHVGTTLNWLSNNRTRKVHLSILTRAGVTTIEAHEKLAPLAAAIYGFGVGGVGVFGLGWTGFIIGINTFHSPPIALGMWAALVAASWGGARAVYAHLVGRRRQQLASLIDDIARGLRDRTFLEDPPERLPTKSSPVSGDMPVTE